MLEWAARWRVASFPSVRFRPFGDLALRSWQPESAGGEPAGQRDSQRIGGGAVRLWPGPHLSGFAGGRSRRSVSGCWNNLASERRRQRSSSVPDLPVSCLFVFCRPGPPKRRKMRAAPKQSSKGKVSLWLLKYVCGLHCFIYIFFLYNCCNCNMLSSIIYKYILLLIIPVR